MALKLLALATMACGQKPVFDYTLSANCPICRQYGNSTVKDAPPIVGEFRVSRGEYTEDGGTMK